MDHTHWMIVANGSCMKLFKFRERERTLERPSVTLHPESTLMQKDFDSDKKGKPPRGYGHDPETMSTKKIEEKKFAKEISHFLKESFEKKEFERLYIAASPTFLGLLREELPKDILNHIAEETNKDLTKVPSSEIWGHFPSRK